MGQKVNSKSLRLPLLRNWDSRWFASKKDNPILIVEDYKIRKFLTKKFKNAAVARVFIERSDNGLRATLFAARPAILIGRKGQDVLEKTRIELHNLTGRKVVLDVREVKKPELVAQLVAESIALQIERRIPYRRILKKSIQAATGAQGIVVKVSGRLGDAEIAREEVQRAGRVPRHTLRENIDYGFAEANTVYGKIGVKCWICKKEDELAQI